jgi:hypothetical protein
LKNNGGFLFYTRNTLRNRSGLSFAMALEDSGYNVATLPGEIMKIVRCCAFVCLALLLCATTSLAQTVYKTGGTTNALTSSTLSGGINLRSIPGVPFSADVVKESTQLMPDGTSARHETHGKMFRDSVGRTRSETELESSIAGAEPKRYVTIVDPLQQISIVLDVVAKKATVFHLPVPTAMPANELKLVARAQSAHRGSAGHSATNGDAPEDLGAMIVEGFSVTGIRRAHPVAASAAKDKPQNAITESWFSAELKIELLSTTQVSQSVTRTTKLTNIVPGEPDPTLFQTPADYAVQENSQQK